ncbi:VirB4 family type IV secretion/conjugal transfer ATPase [Aminobacter sp. MSH1]|uniref:VirB4 family type IV secretion/conjugal transfer ATPase n=1 Tax=Aminobacter sp. MSH1 TaxID=374606 RepID=UPI000D333C3D|nr:VirB4 family type IV secretion/conjugal transfer ATPase [Aminobacter sp. MSH1]
MNASVKYDAQLRGVRSLENFIPFRSLVAPDTVSTTSNAYMRTYRVPGIAFEAADVNFILRSKEHLNSLWRSIASPNVALWKHTVRRRTTDSLSAQYDNWFCQQLNDKYYGMFDGTRDDEAGAYRLMANELYLTLVFRRDVSRSSNLLTRAARRSAAEAQDDMANTLVRLDELCGRIESSMAPYGTDNRGIERLSTYMHDGVLMSEQLSFYNYLLTGVWQHVRVPEAPLNEYLGNAMIHVGEETIQINAPTATRFARAIDFKDYASSTEPGILNGLMYSDYEFVETQSFSFMPKHESVDFLQKTQQRMANTDDKGVSQREELTIALDQLIDGQFAMGEYHYSLLVYGKDMDDVRRNSALALTTLQNAGFMAALSTTATDAAFYAQLPATWQYRPRVARLTTQNFAGMAPFHNFRAGKRDGNPWGQAVTMFKTPSGQPAYVNFHAVRGDEDAFGKKVLGNFCIMGKSGTGKTVLMNFLLCMSQKFRNGDRYTTVLFDKDEGAKASVLAMRGKYLSIKNGEPTGFNPCQIEPSEDNIQFLERLVRVLVTETGERISTADDARISHAVRTVMSPSIPKAARRLSIVLQNITEGGDRQERENSVAKRLAKWCADDGQGKTGTLAWVFDNAEDTIDFTTHDNYGFDGTRFLDNPDTCAPISMYLLHRMESVIDGRRFVYLMDEVWKWIQVREGRGAEAFAEFAGDKQLTIRKQNGLGGFATQQPAMLLQSKIATQLVQQSATMFFLPNPDGKYSEYVDGMGCTEEEFECIRKLEENSRMFLVKQNGQSMLCHLDLRGFDDELKILSGDTANNVVLDEVIAEVGDDPSQWIPVYYDRVRSKTAASRTP